LLGYGYEGDATHLVQLGAEVGLAPSVHFQAELGARGVLGSSRGELGGGVRLTAGADFVLGIFHVEAAYQALATRGDVEHDLRVMAGVDFFRFLLVPIMLMGMH
ncbi:MAG: hypothetical protein KC635_19550, partial [Myxococcales bacterium]|nr:hypothetical protein [Myxococcales bacterium]